MIPDRSIHALFDAAIELPDPAERGRFLDEACGTDRELRAQLEELLSAHENAGGFLSHPSESPALQAALAVPLTEKPGDKIGHYKLLQQIGEGGCGVVYMAEQEEPVKRRVALKVVKLGMDTKQVVARFEAERQALALMDHQNIARVLDAGATASGRPFFVMELVSGVKITEFCDQKGLSPRERLELFTQVCSAIQHAHQKGIIHRDLKPSNILVSMGDSAPVPKIIDFGIAKATNNQRLTDKTLFTAFEQFIGTPAYMSPEQADLTAVDIDTRTDVYSLGVVLYELLTGRPPFEAEELLRLGLDEMRRTIREREPAKPSTRLGKLAAEEATTIAQARKTDIPVLLKTVRGDLDWIVMKCLEKDRNHRYEAAKDLALDVERHLKNEPIVARPPSRIYHVRKLVGRHRAVSGLTAVLLLLMLAGGAMLWRYEQRLRHALRTPAPTAAERQRLHDELVAEARTFTQSGQIGQRFDALTALRRAAEFQPSAEARNAAVAALAKTDLREVARFPVPGLNTGSNSVAFTPDLESFVAAHPDGGFMVQSVRDRKVLAQLNSPTGKKADSFLFSPDGKIVVARIDAQNAEVWSVEDKRLLLSLAGTAQNPAVADVHPDGQRIAGYSPSAGLFVKRFDGSEQQVLDASNSGRTFLRFNPDGTRLAVTQTNGVVEVWDLESTPRVAWTQQVQRIVSWLAWSSTGAKLLAAGEDGRGVRVLNSASGHIEKIFTGHGSSPRQYEFHPDGRTVASVGQDATLRLWDIRTADQRISVPARHLATRFSTDGRRVTAAINDKEVAILELASDKVFSEFQGPGSMATLVNMDRSADGRWLATIGKGLHIWDTATSRELGVTQISGLGSGWLLFDKDTSALLISAQGPSIASPTAGELVRLPFTIRHENAGPPKLQWGEISKLFLYQTGPIGLTRGGRDFWVLHSNLFELWPNQDRSQKRTISTAATFGAVSPDGKWVALHRGGGPTVSIYDGESTEIRITLSTPGVDAAWFSPDSRWLLISRRPEGYNVFSVGDWRPGPSWAARLDIAGQRGDATISDDGRMLAARHKENVYRLFSFPDCRELATLTPPEDFRTSYGVRFSPDGRRLWLGAANHRVFEWNLGALRKELEALGLVWKD